MTWSATISASSARNPNSRQLKSTFWRAVNAQCGRRRLPIMWTPYEPGRSTAPSIWKYRAVQAAGARFRWACGGVSGLPGGAASQKVALTNVSVMRTTVRPSWDVSVDRDVPCEPVTSSPDSSGNSLHIYEPNGRSHALNPGVSTLAPRFPGKQPSGISPTAALPRPVSRAPDPANRRPAHSASRPHWG